MTKGTRRGWGVSVTPRPLFTHGQIPVPIVQEAVWVPEPVWTGAENLAAIGIRFPDRLARSQFAIATELRGPHGKMVTFPNLIQLVMTFCETQRTCFMLNYRKPGLWQIPTLTTTFPASEQIMSFLHKFPLKFIIFLSLMHGWICSLPAVRVTIMFAYRVLSTLIYSPS
jgi:hypothetical protein